MTNDSKLTEDSFTLVTSHRKNKKKHFNKRLIATQLLDSTDEGNVDEEAIIK